MAWTNPADGSFFDLSSRTKLRITGADRIRFVNGQITNDIGKATETAAIAACVLTARGKLDAHIFVSKPAGSIIIDANNKLRESLPSRLERYIIADDVQVEDITEQFAIFHVIGADPGPGMPVRIVAVNRYGAPGFDLWADHRDAAEVQAALARIAPFCDTACREQFRIEQGVPGWGTELTQDTIPVEANLESSCIDYGKGCYIGQEVISRIKMSGQRNKGLYGFIGKQNEPLTPGMKLVAPGNEVKEAGWLTSACWSDRLGKHIALGYVKRPFNQVGAELRAITPQSPGILVEIIELPFNPGGL